MTEITLLATHQAKPGFEFVYMGAAPVCRTCPYRHACLTLDTGRRYRVTRVRPVEHPCALQETQAAVVEVSPAPRTLVVPAGAAVVGGQIELSRTDCRRIDCSNWQVCAGPSVPAKQRFRVQSIENGAAECLIGRSLRRAEVQ